MVKLCGYIKVYISMVKLCGSEKHKNHFFFNTVGSFIINYLCFPSFLSRFEQKQVLNE